MTTLYKAIQKRDIGLVETCLIDGYDVNKVYSDCHRWTPLHLACVRNSERAVRLLLDWGADVNAKDLNRRTPLHWTCETGHAAISRLLVDRGADVNAISIDGSTTLGLAARHLDVVQLLLERGVALDEKHCTDGRGLLYDACEQGKLELCRLLLNRGVNTNRYTYFHWTPLQLASKHGHLEVAQLLLRHGANVNEKSFDGTIPLIYACQYNHLEVVRTLLDHGADAHGCQALETACYLHNLEIARLLLDRGANMDAKNAALHSACCSDYKMGVARLLLDGGADIEAREADEEWTPLHTACAQGNLKIAQLLLDRGADVESVSSRGESPLELACRHRKREIVWLLVQRHPWLIIRKR